MHGVGKDTPSAGSAPAEPQRLTEAAEKLTAKAPLSISASAAPPSLAGPPQSGSGTFSCTNGWINGDTGHGGWIIPRIFPECLLCGRHFSRGRGYTPECAPEGHGRAWRRHGGAHGDPPTVSAPGRFRLSGGCRAGTHSQGECQQVPCREGTWEPGHLEKRAEHAQER